MAEVTVLVEAVINSTETEEKVKTAVANMFGNIPTRVEAQRVGSLLTAEAKGRTALENFGAVLRRDRVRSAARRFLRTNAQGNRIVFCLNKQVAFIGHVSFSQETGESPLGPIKVVIETENPSEIIDWLAPRITET
jgi:predicted RNA binding protein with dsRBD fold (UPF0201 family)